MCTVHRLTVIVFSFRFQAQAPPGFSLESVTNKPLCLRACAQEGQEGHGKAKVFGLDVKVSGASMANNTQESVNTLQYTLDGQDTLSLVQTEGDGRGHLVPAQTQTQKYASLEHNCWYVLMLQTERQVKITQVEMLLPHERQRVEARAVQHHARVRLGAGGQARPRAERLHADAARDAVAQGDEKVAQAQN